MENTSLVLFKIKNRSFPRDDFGIRNDFTFSLVVNSNFSNQTKVTLTSNPVADGTTRMDTISRAAGSINIAGKIGELTNSNRHGLTITQNESLTTKMINLLKYLMTNAIFLDIITEDQTYANYVITDINITKTTFASADVSLSLAEILLYSTPTLLTDDNVEVTTAQTIIPDLQLENMTITDVNSINCSNLPFIVNKLIEKFPDYITRMTSISGRGTINLKYLPVDASGEYWRAKVLKTTGIPVNGILSNVETNVICYGLHVENGREEIQVAKTNPIQSGLSLEIIIPRISTGTVFQTDPLLKNEILINLTTSGIWQKTTKQTFTISIAPPKTQICIYNGTTLLRKIETFKLFNPSLIRFDKYGKSILPQYRVESFSSDNSLKKNSLLFKHNAHIYNQDVECGLSPFYRSGPNAYDWKLKPNLFIQGQDYLYVDNVCEFINGDIRIHPVIMLIQKKLIQKIVEVINRDVPAFEDHPISEI